MQLIGKGTHQIRLPETFTSTEQLIARRATDNKVLRKINTANAIEAANKRLSGLLVDARNDGAHEEGTESALVQRARDEVGHGGGGDVALFAQAVHVDFVTEEIRDRVDIGGQPRQA